MKKKIVLLMTTLGLLLQLTSCATVPTPQEVASADYGEYPTNYEEVIKGYLQPN